MPEYLILKLEGDDPRAAKVAAHVVFEGDPKDALLQGFIGVGRYAIVDWGERIEGDLAPGPVEVASVEDSRLRSEAVEATEKEA